MRFSLRRKALIAFAVPAIALVPVHVWAQSPQPQSTIPSYARTPPPSDEETIQGSILSLHGKYGIQLRDDRGFNDDVQMHQGTIINPTGMSLAPGMRVSIIGHSTGSTFAANEIDAAFPPPGRRVRTPVYPYYPYYPSRYRYPPAFVPVP